MERFTAPQRPRWLGMGVGAVLFAAAVWARFAFADELSAFPFLTFFPAIVLTAFVGGARPAVLVTAASAATAWYYFVPPFNSWDIRPQEAVGIAFFLLVATIDIALVELFRDALSRLRMERTRASDLLATREAMFSELQHRVANNMQFVSGMLAMQQKQFEGTPAGEALEQAAARLRAMSRIHRRLYDPANADREFGPLIEDLCHELLQATGAKNLVCRVEVPSVSLPLDRVHALSMIVTEALTNAVKHAYPDGQPGTIRISLTQNDGKDWMLTIADDGRGLPENFDPAIAQSLGMRIVQALATQLNGALTFANGAPGAEMRLRFQT